MFDELKRKFMEMAPNWLYAAIRVLYRMLRYHEIVLFIPHGDSWRVVRGDSKFFVPTPKAGVTFFPSHPYERFFEARTGDVVLDVGAGIGRDTIYFARKVGKEGLVIAIEPEPKNLVCLRANIAEKRISNVLVIEKAAWSCGGKLKLYLGESIADHSATRDFGRGSIEVQADTLDNIISDLRVNKVDFIKMDVEGAELEALEGAERVLSMAKKVVVAAYHIRNGEVTSLRVSQFLKNRGFQVHASFDNLIYAVKYRQRREREK